MFLPIGDINPTRRVPVMNYVLIGANVLVFLAFGMAPAEEYQQTVLHWGLVPATLHGPGGHGLVTLFTSMFLHGDILHLAGNMLFLWICGDNVEDMLGSPAYLVFYLCSGIAAGLGHAALNAGSEVPCIGASGAIAGILGAYVMFFPRSKIKIFYFFWWFWCGTFLVDAVWAIGFWFAEQALLTMVTIREASASTGVAYAAHVGGFLLGLAVAFVLRGAGIVRPPVVRVARYYQRPYRPFDSYW